MRGLHFPNSKPFFVRLSGRSATDGCSETEVTEARGYPPAVVPIGARSTCIASAARYGDVAGQIVAALRGGTRPFGPLTGNPPPVRRFSPRRSAMLRAPNMQ